MPKSRKPPELAFQTHLADYLVREHGFGILEQSAITDAGFCIAEDHLWEFLASTQADTLKKLAEDYGTDARQEVIRTLRTEMDRTPLWLIMRRGLDVRGLSFRLYYPKPRSLEGAAGDKYEKNRIAFRPHFYFGDAN